MASAPRATAIFLRTPPSQWRAFQQRLRQVGGPRSGDAPLRPCANCSCSTSERTGLWMILFGMSGSLRICVSGIRQRPPRCRTVRTVETRVDGAGDRLLAIGRKMPPRLSRCRDGSRDECGRRIWSATPWSIEITAASIRTEIDFSRLSGAHRRVAAGETADPHLARSSRAHEKGQPMEATASTAAASEKSTKGRGRFGPAFVTAALVFGPGSITTASSLGADFAYDLVWVPVLATILMLCFVNLSVRIGADHRPLPHRHGEREVRTGRRNPGRSRSLPGRRILPGRQLDRGGRCLSGALRREHRAVRNALHGARDRLPVASPLLPEPREDHGGDHRGNAGHLRGHRGHLGRICSRWRRV